MAAGVLVAGVLVAGVEVATGRVEVATGSRSSSVLRPGTKIKIPKRMMIITPNTIDNVLVFMPIVYQTHR